MTTTATSKRRPTAPRGGATKPEQPSLEELVHYSPEDVYKKGWLPFTPRTLRNKANAREIPYSIAGGRISFTARHIREIAAMYEVRPISESKPAAPTS
ncbi:hypothetical protein [Streptomyces sp. NPDC048196]|uniref:hypothetical protein n=1 Tax=Streptomyces sp. NPDC048196 TaxID=3154712 RepID=UPI0033DD504D